MSGCFFLKHGVYHFVLYRIVLYRECSVASFGFKRHHTLSHFPLISYPNIIICLLKNAAGIEKAWSADIKSDIRDINYAEINMQRADWVQYFYSGVYNSGLPSTLISLRNILVSWHQSCQWQRQWLLWSAADRKYVVPCAHNTFDDKSFAADGLWVWNNVLFYDKDISYRHLKWQLKIFLFGSLLTIA